MAKLPKRDMDKQPLGFGKYAEQTPEEIAEADPSYIVWMYENVEPKDVAEIYIKLQIWIIEKMICVNAIMIMGCIINKG